MRATRKGLSPRGRGNRIAYLAAVHEPGSIPAWAGEPSSLWPAYAPLPVYPRVGGGTLNDQLDTLDRDGLSPRGRGNPPLYGRLMLPCRSIPAWAGEPSTTNSTPLTGTVYPRVGGGTGASTARLAPVGGLSPRGRGNQGSWRHPRHDAGSIPAWAGEPVDHAPDHDALEVYPRVGGGTKRRRRAQASAAGLSPRGRGNLGVCLVTSFRHRSIPAWAGEPGRCGG